MWGGNCRVHRCWLMSAAGNAVYEIARGAGYNIRRLLLRITFLRAWRIAILEWNWRCSCLIDDRMLQSGDFAGGLDNEQTARLCTPAYSERVRKVAGRQPALMLYTPEVECTKAFASNISPRERQIRTAYPSRST